MASDALLFGLNAPLKYVVRHHESHIMSEKKYLSFLQI